jgi:hypothetical protein
MAIRNASTIVGFDAETGLAAIRESAEGTPFTVVEFDADRYNPLFVSEEGRALYRDEEQMTAHFDAIHSFASIDFNEIDLFTEELFPIAEDVHYIATGLDYLTLLRIYFDRSGLFIALDPDQPVDPVVEAVEDAVG